MQSTLAVGRHKCRDDARRYPRLLYTLLALAACNPTESPTALTSEVTVPRPSNAFTGGSGKLLASTNQGNLVEIDLDADTIRLLGDAGTFAGDSVGWTDIAFDDTGILYGVSRVFFESDFEVHLYTIDQSDGSVLTDVGSLGDHVFADFDHDGSAFYGSGRGFVFDCCGRLFMLDKTAPAATFISPEDPGYGINPFSGGVISHGGFAIHPITGEMWGVEALQSTAPVIYTIDPATGEADQVFRLGLNGSPAPQQFGFDGLHILDDGTFLATRGGSTPPSQAIWEIDSTPDANSLMNITQLTLGVDSAIKGSINGLTRAPAGTPNPGPTSLSLVAQQLELRPWITGTAGEAATVTVSALQGQSPVVGQTVGLRAEVVPTGLHGHLPTPLRLPYEHSPTHVYGGPNPVAQPVTGYLKDGDTRSATLQGTTDMNGQFTFEFVAGWVGIEADLIVTATIAGQPVADTLRFVIRVPGLTSLHLNQTALANALFVGGTTHHPQFTNWFLLPQPAAAMRAFAQAMHQSDGNRYVQLNDASLGFGGSFSVTPPQGSTGVRMDVPGIAHVSHAVGIDMDVALCWATLNGATEGQTGRVSPDEGPPDVFTCPGNSEVLHDDVEAFARAYGIEVIPEDDHYHLRYVGN